MHLSGPAFPPLSQVSTLCQEKNLSWICLKRSVVPNLLETWLLTFVQFALAQFRLGLSWFIFQVSKRHPPMCWPQG